MALLFCVFFCRKHLFLYVFMLWAILKRQKAEVFWGDELWSLIGSPKTKKVGPKNSVELQKPCLSFRMIHEGSARKCLFPLELSFQNDWLWPDPSLIPLLAAKWEAQTCDRAAAAAKPRLIAKTLWVKTLKITPQTTQKALEILPKDGDNQ